MFPTSTWNHCPTDQNPADLFTRGITPSQLQASSLWTNGPAWFLQESEWPLWNPSRTINLSLVEGNDTEPSKTIPSEITPNNANSGIHLIIDTSRYSSLTKRLSVTACVRRFVQNMRKDKRSVVGPISATTKKGKHFKYGS